MTPKVINAATEEPVSIAEARAHLEAQAYEDTDVDPIDDAMIEAWLGAAREHCEAFLGLSLATKTLEVALDAFPAASINVFLQRRPSSTAIDLPGGPVRAIISITVPPPDVEWTSDDVDSDALSDAPIWADGTVNPDLYILDDYRSPNQVRPVASSWPSVAAAPNAVKVRYLAGYGVDSDGGEPIPKALRAAILLILGHLYENRTDSTEKAMTSIPNGAEALMRPLRVRLGMA